MVLRKILTRNVPANRRGRALGRAAVLGVVATILLVLGFAGLATAERKISEEGVCGPAPDAETCPEEGRAPSPLLIPPPAVIPFGTGPTDVMQPSPQQAATPPSADQQPAERGRRLRSALSGETAGAFVVHFFWGRGCPHCEEEKSFLDRLKAKYPGMQVKDYEVWYDKANAEILSLMAKGKNLKMVGVPVTFVGEEVFVGFTEQTRVGLEGAIQQHSRKQHPAITGKKAEALPTAKAPVTVPEGDGRGEPRDAPSAAQAPAGPQGQGERASGEVGSTVSVPLLGALDTSKLSLPFMTVVLAGLDSFNPCAFFVLFSLLGLLVHAQSRRSMFLIGSIFVFFSGFIYFLFMAAWLNLFLVMGHVRLVTGTAGAVSVAIAAVNIKEFFAFKKGLSLTIPDSAKPKLFDRMRKLMRSTSFPSMVTGAAVLAVAANSYELLCTAGFPMVFTRILTLSDLSPLSYYVYLVLYNVVYVIPLSLIVAAFTVTLGKRKLTEREGRVLKLVSGTMMLGLGGVLVYDPALLNNIGVSALLLAASLCVSGCIVFVTKRLRRSVIT